MYVDVDVLVGVGGVVVCVSVCVCVDVVWCVWLWCVVWDEGEWGVEDVVYCCCGLYDVWLRVELW